MDAAETKDVAVEDPFAAAPPRRDWLLMLGIAIVAVVTVLAVIGPYIGPYSPTLTTPRVATPPPGLTEIPGLLAGWIYVIIVSIRELSTSILLYSPDTQVISVVIWELWENGQYVELSALGVLFIISLFMLVMVAQWLGRRYGVRE